MVDGNMESFVPREGKSLHVTPWRCRFMPMSGQNNELMDPSEILHQHENAFPFVIVSAVQSFCIFNVINAANLAPS